MSDYSTDEIEEALEERSLSKWEEDYLRDMADMVDSIYGWYYQYHFYR